MELHHFYYDGLVQGGCTEQEAETLAQLLVELDARTSQLQNPVASIFPF
jgi:hypothetical protein